MLRFVILLLGSIISGYSGFAKNTVKAIDCNQSIHGMIIDQTPQTPLAFATIYIAELNQGIQTDSSGTFSFQNICPGTYTFRLSHVGCESKDTIITISGNTELRLTLDHQVQELLTTEIFANRVINNEIAIQQSVKNLYLKDPSKDLGQVLSNISGVNVLQSGTNIFKPIIHGLHSDRLLILQNQVKLAGQSWGAEHAPEIDASSAQSIQVIKGAGGIEYGTDALGGVILVHQSTPNYDTSWTGQVNTSFSTNQKGTATHTRTSKGWILKKDQNISLQIGGTYKRFGDAKAPDYVLSNTGFSERNAFSGIAYLKKLNNIHVQSQTFYNYYYRKSGILTASHVGNITDLENAIASNRPLVINDWTYKILYPRQQTHHYTFKEHLQLTAPWGKLQAQYDFQQDWRQEFDQRRNGRSEIPVMDLKLYTHHIATKFNRQIQQFDFNSGVEYYLKDNTNVPGTGFRPVIPDYRQHIFAVWARNQWKQKKVMLEAGMRYEHQQLNVAMFNEQEILIRPRRQFNTFAFMLVGDIQINKVFHLTSNIAIASRAPNINELFSSGIHQSAASIEYGDPDMKPEQSFKWTNRFGLKWDDKARLDITPYFHFIKDYIYLEPQKTFENTIRGAFPVFRFQQLDVVGIAGIDAELTFYPIVNLLRLHAQYSFIRMNDLTTQTDLIGTPPNQLKLSAGVERTHWRKLLNLYAVVEWKYVGEQLFVSSESDFLAPPSAYHILSFNSNMEWLIKNRTMGAGLEISNLSNTSYRDYLDRFRYFADLPGINFTLKWHFNF